MDACSPKERARRGMRKRKINSSTKRKLQHMGGQLCHVLMVCAATLGSFAEEVFAEPVYDLWQATGFSDRTAGVDCLELFAGNAEISSAFARKGMGVLRPRDLRYGDDLRQPEVLQEVFREIRENRPKMVWIAPPCTSWCAFSRLDYTKQERRRRRAKEKVFPGDD